MLLELNQQLIFSITLAIHVYCILISSDKHYAICLDLVIYITMFMS